MTTIKTFQIHQPGLGLFAEEKLQPLAKNKVRIAIKSVGICGSDIHYFFNARCGVFEIKAPFIAGHEASGKIIQSNNISFNEEQRVAINPGAPCGNCRQCRSNHGNLCEHLSFFGTASTWPHSHGFLRQIVDVLPEQCFPLTDDISYAEGACAEPLAVALHAIRRTTNIGCKNILVIGAGPVGLLIGAAVNALGANNVAICDLQPNALDIAKNMGIPDTFNVLTQDEELTTYSNFLDGFDIIFEATGSHNALERAIRYCRRGGYIVQVGCQQEGTTVAGFSAIMINEITYSGSMRFTNQDYADAVAMINQKKINLHPMLTHNVPFEQVEKGFTLAKDKNLSSKVQISINAEFIE